MPKEELTIEKDAEELDQTDELESEDEEDRGDKVEEDAEKSEKAEEDEPEAEPAKGSRSVPHSRFNEVNESLKAEREARIRAEERLKLLEEQKTSTKAAPEKETQHQTIDLKALRKQRMEAMMEGDADKAETLDEQIEAEVERRATDRAMQKVEAREAERDFAGAVKETLEKYPFLDSSSKDKNQAAIDEVVEWRDFYLSKGKPPAEAIRLAAAKIAPAFQGDEEEAQPEKKDDLAAVRRKRGLERNADAANRQPPSPGGMGNRTVQKGGELNVEDLDEDEFAKLPAKEKARLRGDFVAG